MYVLLGYQVYYNRYKPDECYKSIYTYQIQLLKVLRRFKKRTFIRYNYVYYGTWSFKWLISVISIIPFLNRGEVILCLTHSYSMSHIKITLKLELLYSSALVYLLWSVKDRFFCWGCFLAQVVIQQLIDWMYQIRF